MIHHFTPYLQVLLLYFMFCPYKKERLGTDGVPYQS